MPRLSRDRRALRRRTSRLWTGAAAISQLAAACAGYPTVEERLDDEVVATVYDDDADFPSFATFSVDTTVYVIELESDGDVQSGQLEPTAADALLNALSDHLTGRGYTRVAASEMPDLGVTLTGLQGEVSGTLGGVGWWGNYGSVWGYPGWAYYYPFPVSYSYERGALVAELVDLRAARALSLPIEVEAAASARQRAGEIPVIWAAIAYGVLAAEPSPAALQAAIDQAFDQSPQLGR